MTTDIPAAALSRVRSGLAQTVRDRVAGEDGPAKAQVIWGTPGPRWFTPDDPVWRVHADASMFVGGIRALLLQSLHPLAMAGVAGHSGYRGDPWGRLQRTSTFLATTTFGTIEAAEEAIGTVRTVHERVRGKTDDGRAYSASDPHLLAWVHLAETDSFLAAYQRHATKPLSVAEADRYVAQTAVVARRLGVEAPPADVAGLYREIEAFRPELEGTAAAREAARFLLLHPPLPVAARAGYAALAAGAVALLPRWARAPLGLLHLPVTERLVTSQVSDLATGVLRWAMAAPGVEVERARQRPGRSGSS